MKCSPDAAVAVTVTKKGDLFRGHLRNAERVEEEDQLAVFASGNEGVEISWPLRRVNISQRAQLAIVAQLFAQQLLVITIQFASFARLRTAGAHLHMRRRSNLFEGLVSEANDQM